MVEVLIGGLMVGAMYALFNLGVVVTYRQSGVINFAQGAVATVSAVVAYEVIGAGLAWWVGLIAAVGCGAVVQAVMEWTVISRMPWASEWTAAVSAVGVALLLVGVVEVVWGNYPEVLPQPIAQRVGVRIGAVLVPGEEFLVVGLAVALTVVLLLLIERTRFGLMVRATSEGPVTAEMLGVPVERVRRASWAMAGGVAGLAGVIITPAYQLDPTTMTIFSIGAFAGVVLGGLESIGGTLIGSLVVGVGFTFVTYVVGGTWVYPASLVIVLIVLIVRPHGIFGRRLKRVAEPSLPPTRVGAAWAVVVFHAVAERLGRVRGAAGWVERVTLHGPIGVVRAGFGRLGLLVVLGAAVVAIPPVAFGSNTVFDLALLAAMYPAVLGQKVISGDSGQISVGTSGFMVVGGYAFTELIIRVGVGPLLALAGAVIVCAAIGVALNLAAGRLHGGYLALVTLLFALAVPQVAGAMGGFTGSFSGLGLPVVKIAGLKLIEPQVMYVASAVLALMLAAGVGWMTRGAAGRRWHAVRDSEVGAAACGMSVVRVKAEAFAVGGMLAGIGGAVTAVLVAFMSPTSYTFWNSIYLLAAVVVGGQASLLGSLIGTALIVLLPIATAGAGGFPDLIFGAVVVVVMLYSPNGFVVRRREAVGGRGLSVRTDAKSGGVAGASVVAAEDARVSAGDAAGRTAVG